MSYRESSAVTRGFCRNGRNGSEFGHRLHRLLRGFAPVQRIMPTYKTLQDITRLCQAPAQCIGTKTLRVVEKCLKQNAQEQVL